MNNPESDSSGNKFDHSSHQEFYEYYAKQSQDPGALVRLQGIVKVVLRVLGKRASEDPPLNVLDVGCGAGTLTMLWAKAGHHAHGLDVNAPLLALAQERAEKDGLQAEFRVGSATDLPWPAETMDVCVVPELLEHVAEWERCLDEACRVLRPGGVLYISTSNKLCPKQNEFNLRFYSWYPGFLKRRYERLAVTTRPDIANYAKYPAVNWFTYFQLRDELLKRGCVAQDRFDLMRRADAGWLRRSIPALMGAVPPLRWIGHVLTPYTVLAARKN